MLSVRAQPHLSPLPVRAYFARRTLQAIFCPPHPAGRHLFHKKAKQISEPLLKRHLSLAFFMPLLFCVVAVRLLLFLHPFEAVYKIYF